MDLKKSLTAVVRAIFVDLVSFVGWVIVGLSIETVL